MQRLTKSRSAIHVHDISQVQHYFFEKELPAIGEEHLEFPVLMRYLALSASATHSMDDGLDGVQVCDGISW